MSKILKTFIFNLKLIQTYGPNFRPAVNLLPVYFGGGVLLLVVVVLVTGVKQSQLLDLSLCLGLEFDNSSLIHLFVLGDPKFLRA